MAMNYRILAISITLLAIFLAGCAKTGDGPKATATPIAPNYAGQATPAPTQAIQEATATPAAPTQTPAPQQTAAQAPPVETDKIIQITASGFSPSELSIKSGETVLFINKDSKPHWPASSPHPSHDAYPQKGGCIGSAFDACKALSQGEYYAFKFRFNGNWAYHDHLNPTKTGTIQVG